MYVINGKLGVFTNADSTKVYTGTVYGKNNEILMTVKDKDNNFYSYWAAEVTDPSATMATYRVEEYNKNLAKLVENDDALNRNDIKEVTLTKGDDSAIIRLVRNGGNAVDGAITVTSGGGTDGKDTFVKISNAADTEGKTFATGSKVEAIVDKGATTGIKINGEAYTIKSGSVVNVAQTADKKTTTITVDGTETTITDTDTHNALKSASLSGKTLTITGKDDDSVNVDLSSIDTDTKYTAGNGIAIDGNNGNAISVKLKEGENNLEVTEAGLELKKALTVNSVKAGDFYMSTAGIGYDDKAYITSSGLNANSQKITGVAAGTISEGSTDAVNGSQLKETNTKVENLKVEAGKHTTLFNGENTTVELVGDGKNGKQYKVNVDLSQYAKTEDVAVVYDKNKTSLRSTNATLQTSSKEEEAVDSIALGKDASAVKESVAIGNGASVVEGNNGLGGVALGYKAHAGYKGTSLGSNAISGREGTTLVGANTNSGSLYTTVVGTDSVINSDGTSYEAFGRSINVQGATATVVGSKNTVDNKNGKVYSGVANNVMGSANTVEGSNGVTIQGTGNKVTDAYKDMNIGAFEAYNISKGDYSALAKKKSGAVAVIGGANTVSKQTDSTVIGYGNKLTGDNEKGSHDVFMAGSHNELTNVSDSIVMGNKNVINGVSNVISFGHQNEITANNAVAIGSGAGVSAEGGVALGVGSVASTAAGALGYGADGKTDATWQATKGAVSVGGNGVTRQITNVAAGTEDTDAVNVAQLKKVSDTANAGWNLSTNGFGTEATNVKPGDYVDFSGDKNISVSHDGTKVQVELNKNIDVNSIQTNALNSTTGAKLGQVTIAADGKISGVAAGEADTDAVNVSQLNAVATEAGKHTTLSNGKNTTVESTVKDGQTDYKVNVAGDLTDITSVANGDSKINLNKDSIIISNGNKYFAITNSGIGMSYIGADYSAKSIMLGENGTTISGGLNVAGSKITGVAAGTEDTDAVNVSQLKKVSDTANAGWNLATNGVATGATNVKPGDYVDFSGDKNISVSHDGTKVKVELNKNIDVNSIQTNALNSKYSLSVGTMAENGIMPFLVSSTGAFYAANNNFSVDKDGKVIATAGEIGNVVLQNGVYTGKSALRDGELYLGDASGNYSQITPKSAKLGQVTIDEKGNMAGVNSIQTNALNAKYNLSVGTMAENGIMPFLVSSTGAFYAANNNFSVDKDGKVIATAGEIGNVVLQNGVYTGKSALRDGELYLGDASGNYSQITTTGAKLGQVTIAADGKISGVAAGEADTDAVNVSQLKEAVQAGNTDTHIKPGEYGVGADNKVNMDVVDKNGNKVDTVTIKDVAKASDVGNVNNIADDIKNGEGHTTVVDAVNNLNQKLDNKVGDLNYVEGGKGNYVTNGENTTTSIGKLDQALKDVADTANQGWNLSTNGGEASKVAPGKTVDFSGDKNIKISNDGTNVKVELNKDIDVDTVTANTVTTGQTVMNNDGVKVGTDVSLNKDGLKVGDKVSVSATAVTAGQTSINNDGLAVGPNTSLKADELKVDGKTYIDKNGLNANGMQITNVADGKENSDAVNVGQLKESEKTINNRINGVENQVISNSNRINQLGNRVNKVGAGAAALAALHPMDFDPDDKLTFSAGYGNYGGENAAAIGAYYRPDEKVMFSVAGTVGNGENMVNAGVSFALDRTNHVSNSRTALAREVIDLRGQLAVMGAKMAKMEKAFGMLDETKTKLFPDVPANHWAYEYIAKLAGNGYIEGYPDGNFGGDRLMTRYEFAAMLYRAIEKGAALEEKIIKEFEPELGRIRVDRISGEDGDRDKIERVRVNDTKGERDHYGNKLAK